MIQKNERRRYASDLSDSQWAIIEPLFPRAGNRSKWEKRELADAVLYFVDNGCKWRNLLRLLLLTSGTSRAAPFIPIRPAIKKSPRIAVFTRLPGDFLASWASCPPRYAAADVRPPVASGHKKRRRPAVDAFALNDFENVRAFPALNMLVPVDIRGFSSTSPGSPALSRFSHLSCPRTLNGL